MEWEEELVWGGKWCSPHLHLQNVHNCEFQIHYVDNSEEWVQIQNNLHYQAKLVHFLGQTEQEMYLPNLLL